MSTPMTPAPPVDHDHPDIDGDLAEHRNAPPIEHLRNRGPGRHGQHWLPPIDQSERAGLHARLHAQAPPPPPARLETQLTPEAALEIVRAFLTIPGIGHTRLNNDLGIDIAQIVAEAYRIGGTIKQLLEQAGAVERELGQLRTDLAGFRRILGLPPIPQVETCGWCPGERPLVRYHPHGQVQHVIPAEEV